MVNQFKNRRGGFTIIEILVGIVVIGILVGIVTVSFTGITKQTRQAALENALIDTAGKVRAYNSENGSLPSSLDNIEKSKNPDIDIIYTSSGYPNFCLQGSVEGVAGSFKIDSSNSSVVSGTCPTPLVVHGAPVQTVTKTNCPILRTMVTDKRDNHTYWIQKLADGNCWMLNNLAYAGAGNNTYNDTVALSVGTDYTYTEAKYYIPTGANPTTAPTEPSTSTNGTGQYGYLYNWCAAMGGQDTAACADATTPAPIPTTNICPAGWRLPTGEPTTGEFTALNTAINAGSTSSDAGLLTSGLFQRSGYWYNGFNNQGSNGNYWSSSQGSATYAHVLYFYSTNVSPANGSNKKYGFAVRCVAE